MKRASLVVLAALAASLGRSEDAAAPAVTIRPLGEQRYTASGTLPPGAEYHLIWEDPRTHAVQAVLKAPNKYAIPAHSHSHDETLLVLSGKVRLDFGTRVETLSAGEYALIPAGTAFALEVTSWGGSRFLVTFSGPFDSKAAVLPK